MKRKLLFALCLFFSLSTWSQINTDRLTDNGRSALFFDDYVLSIQYFNQVIDIKPHLPEPYYYRTIAKIELEDFVGAEADCSKALELNPFMPTAYYARGFARKRLGNYIQAEADFTKALEFSPENEEYLINRIEAYELLKEFDKAMKDIDLLQTKKTSSANLVWLEKGNIYLQQGDTTKAFDTFNIAIKKDSTNPDAWGARAIIFLQRNDNKNALSDYNKAISLKSKNIGHYINRGILNYRDKNYRGAISDYDKAVELDSVNTQALFNRGLLRTEVGDLNNAISDFSKILSLDEKNDEARYQRAVTSLSIKDFKQAKLDFNQLIEKYPSFVPAYFGRADAYAALGNTRQASIDRYHGQKLMEEKDKGIKKKEKSIDAKEQIAQTQPSIVDQAKEFDSGTSDNNSKYNDKIRGAVQNNITNLQNKRNYIITYYSPNDNLRRINNYTELIEDYKEKNKSNIVLSNDEAPLTQTLVQYHFNHITQLNEQIKQDSTNSSLYFERGVNYALVQNQDAAIEDFSHAINIDKNFVLAYFCRANILYKLLDFELNSEKRPAESDKSSQLNTDKTTASKFSLIMQDYNKVIELAPTFSFAWFNRGNAFYLQKDYKSAIKDYTEAINTNKNFAEAYFNRGLSYMFNNEKDKGLADLSKAGELGIYQAYNLIKRFRE